MSSSAVAGGDHPNPEERLRAYLPSCNVWPVTAERTPGHGAHLIELVLDLDGPVNAVEPLLRALRTSIESVAGAVARQLGTHVTQELGRLTCTVRAVIDGDDLAASAQAAAGAIRPLVNTTFGGTDEVRVRETAIHARVL